jgi:hypothetical protein
MMALGGVLSIFDRRYKNKMHQKEKSASQEQGTSQVGV